VSICLSHGDSRELLPFAPPGFALAYIDPPFFTQRAHTMPDGETAFEDRWESLGAFVDTVIAIAQPAWRSLRPGGSLVVMSTRRRATT
jgi:hypothetical protein